MSSNSVSSTQVVAAKVGDGLEVRPQTPQQYSDVARFAANEGKTCRLTCNTGVLSAAHCLRYSITE